MKSPELCCSDYVVSAAIMPDSHHQILNITMRERVRGKNVGVVSVAYVITRDQAALASKDV